MVSGTAGNNHQLLHRADVFVRHIQFFNYDLISPDPRRKRICDRLRLLVHLLEHKMLIAALFRSIHVPFDVDRLFLDLLFIHIEELHRILLHADDLFIFDKINISRILQYRRHI